MFSRRTRHLTEVEVIQLKRLFSATKSRLVRTQANRPLHLSQWYEQMWKTRFTVHVPPRERALAEVQWPESLRPFHLKTCGRVRDSPVLMLLNHQPFCQSLLRLWVMYILCYSLIWIYRVLSVLLRSAKTERLWTVHNLQPPCKESFLGLYWRNFIISYILSCIIETLGEGINFV